MKILERLNPFRRDPVLEAHARVETLHTKRAELEAIVAKARAELAAVQAEIRDMSALGEIGLEADEKAVAKLRKRRTELDREITAAEERIVTLDHAEQIQSGRVTQAEADARQASADEASAELIELFEEALPHLESLAVVCARSTEVATACRHLGKPNMAAMALPAFNFSVATPTGDRMYKLDAVGMAALKGHLSRSRERLNPAVKAAEAELRKLTNERPAIADRLRTAKNDQDLVERRLAEELARHQGEQDITLIERLRAQADQVGHRVDAERAALEDMDVRIATAQKNVATAKENAREQHRNP